MKKLKKKYVLIYLHNGQVDPEFEGEIHSSLKDIKKVIDFYTAKYPNDYEMFKEENFRYIEITEETLKEIK